MALLRREIGQPHEKKELHLDARWAWGCARWARSWGPGRDTHARLPAPGAWPGGSSSKPSQKVPAAGCAYVCAPERASPCPRACEPVPPSVQAHACAPERASPRVSLLVVLVRGREVSPARPGGPALVAAQSSGSPHPVHLGSPGSETELSPQGTGSVCLGPCEVTEVAQPRRGGDGSHPGRAPGRPPGAPRPGLPGCSSVLLGLRLELPASSPPPPTGRSRWGRGP